MGSSFLLGPLVLCALLAAGPVQDSSESPWPDYQKLELPTEKRVVEPGRFHVMVGGSSDAVKSVALDVADRWAPSPACDRGRRRHNMEAR